MLQNALRLEAAGLTRKAEREYRAIIEKAPRNATALMRLGLLLCARGAFDKAALLFKRAGLADPRDLASRMNLAAALLRIGDEQGAVEAYREAVVINPLYRDARLNLAYRLRGQRRLDEARVHYQALVEHDPRDGLARWNLAALDGLEGDLDAAFAGFADPRTMRAAGQPKSLPRWAGEPLAGRRILLEADQGLGDTLMFSRLAARVHAEGGQVILRAQPELEGLLANLDGVALFAPRDRPPPNADLWIPLADLPAVLGVEASIAAAPDPYLAADPTRRMRWREWLKRPAPDCYRVGLVWAGGSAHPEDSLRSLPLAVLLEPLIAIEGVVWISLQKGPPAAEAEGTALVRADLDIADFEDTAALLAEIDLLITVDTSILHLAGALGRPVWGLIAFVPDWRWMLERPDSPWHPSLRLFRQARSGDWRDPTREVATALRERLSEARAVP